MKRESPEALSDAQRVVLSEFFAGRIPAGQLTERLGIEAPEVTPVDSDVHRRRAVRICNPLRGLASRRSIAPSAPSRPGRAETRA
jgi:hypothetical protein